MDFTVLTLRILFIFVPGIIGTEVLFKLIEVDKSEKRDRYIISSFLLGSVSYLILNLFYFLFANIASFFIFLFSGRLNFTASSISFFKFINEETGLINEFEVLLAIVISAFLGVIIAYINNKKFISKIAQRYRVSSKFDELDVWTYAMNSDEDYWIIIRDIENDLLYEGWPKAYSNSHNCEILLTNVEVYRNSKASRPLYSIDQVYFSFREEKMIVEFRKDKKGK